MRYFFYHKYIFLGKNKIPYLAINIKFSNWIFTVGFYLLGDTGPCIINKLYYICKSIIYWKTTGLRYILSIIVVNFAASKNVIWLFLIMFSGCQSLESCSYFKISYTSGIGDFTAARGCFIYYFVFDI